jgi:DNA-binding SARP family transcriptional activator
VTSPKLRAVLAHLVIHAREPVTVDALVYEVWQDRPPRSATNTLQTYISHLRQLLGPDVGSAVVRTLPGGYQLDVEPHTIDQVRFEDAVRDGRVALDAGDPEKAGERLRDSLALWRGPALANVDSPGARAEAARLAELRLEALQARIEADLACGRHGEVVGELDGLVRQYPWREAFVGQLMVALYRCGRQADALARYRDTHARLAAELGIVPGQELQDLQRRILRHDRDLAVPARGPASTGGRAEAADEGPGNDAPETVGSDRPHRRPLYAVFAVCLAIAATLVGLGGAWISRRGGSDQAPGVAIFNEFDLAVHPGIGYDLDIPPGRPADWHATNNSRSPDYDFLDLYRTSERVPEGENQISGVDLRNTNDFNAIHLVSDTDPPPVCTGLPQRGGGNVKMRDLRVGARVCLHTHDGRWAMIVIRRMPADRAALLFVQVTVLSA